MYWGIGCRTAAMKHEQPRLPFLRDGAVEREHAVPEQFQRDDAGLGVGRACEQRQLGRRAVPRRRAGWRSRPAGEWSDRRLSGRCSRQGIGVLREPACRVRRSVMMSGWPPAWSSTGRSSNAKICDFALAESTLAPASSSTSAANSARASREPRDHGRVRLSHACISRASLTGALAVMLPLLRPAALRLPLRPGWTLPPCPGRAPVPISERRRRPSCRPVALVGGRAGRRRRLEGKPPLVRAS